LKFVPKINTCVDFVTAPAAIPADNRRLAHYDNHTLPPGQRKQLFSGRENTCEPFGALLPFFLWTWRLLNFVRNLVMNLFFILLVLVGAGLWMQFSDSKAEHASRGALLMDITGVVVDKPASNRLGRTGRQLFGAAPTACRKTPVRYRRHHSSGNQTGISPGSCWI
jgi:hypothetical protein